MAKGNLEEIPDTLVVTARERFVGTKKNKKTGQHDIVEVGDDIELDYNLALRLERSGKIAIDDELRDGVKASVKASGAKKSATEKASAAKASK
jgi:hypothetical protein